MGYDGGIAGIITFITTLRRKINPGFQPEVLVFETNVNQLVTINYTEMTQETGTKENPWRLKTPPLSSEFTMYKDIKVGNEILVCPGLPN